MSEKGVRRKTSLKPTSKSTDEPQGKKVEGNGQLDLRPAFKPNSAEDAVITFFMLYLASADNLDLLEIRCLEDSVIILPQGKLKFSILEALKAKK